MAKSQIFNTGYFSLSSQSEHLFLSVTPALKHGPGIKRDGITSPRMKDPHSVGTVTLNSSPPIDPIFNLDDTTNAFEQRAGTWTIYNHLKEFYESRGDEWLIIGAQGCGDLTMNPWHIAYIGRSYLDKLEDQICGMLINDEYKEPFQNRVYRCLVKWREESASEIGSQYEFLDLKFISDDPNYIKIDDPEIALKRERDAFKKLDGYQSGLRNICPFIEFALGGKTILQKGNHVPLVTASDKFQDVRHIFSIPHQVPCSGSFKGQPITNINLGEYQLYDDLNARRAALNGPIIIDTDLSSSGAFFHIDWGILQNYLDDHNFKLVSDSPRRAGEYCLHKQDKTVEIYFSKNVYPFGILGMHKNEIICLSSSGLSGRIGNTLEGITRIMIDGFSAEEAMVLDEGWDVFQIINPTCDLRLMSVATTDELVDEGQSLVIVALIGTALHIRIFDVSGEQVVDKVESELIAGEALTQLRRRLDPFPDESNLSPEDKQEIIKYATSSAGQTPFRYTNEELLEQVLTFTYEQMQKDIKNSNKDPVNAPELGENMREFLLNQNLLQIVEDDWNKLLLRGKGDLDYSDVFRVKPGRSQIRSVIIFAVRKQTNLD